MSKRTKAMPKSTLVLGKLIRVCAGDRHAWYETGHGPVRKPYTPPKIKFNE